MSFWSAVVLIVLIGCVTQVLTTRYAALKQSKGTNGSDRSDLVERDAEREELHQLRERVKVLETIATDPARRTAEEIEKLRD